MKVERLTPILNVSNIEESFAWFEKLGWKKGWDWGEGQEKGNGENGPSTDYADSSPENTLGNWRRASYDASKSNPRRDCKV